MPESDRKREGSLSVPIILTYTFNRNTLAKLYLPSRVQSSDIELLRPKIET